MNYVECSTQKELERAVANGDIPILRSGVFTAYDSAQVRAYDSAQVTAYDSAQVRAYDSAQVRAYDSAQVTATPYVAVTNQSKRTKITGGVVIELPDLSDRQNWFDFYGIKVKAGKVTLFKAVNDEFKSERGMNYAPGQKPSAPDFNTKDTCGGGLHLGPTPFHAKKYYNEATKFVACTVKVEDVIVITEGTTRDKVKVRAISKCVEVNEDGEPLTKAGLA